MPIFLPLYSCGGSGATARYTIKYQPDIHGCDVLGCGNDGASVRQSLNHHANPWATLKHTKRAWDAHFCTEAYVGIPGSESAKICAYVSTSCHYKKKDVDTRRASWTNLSGAVTVRMTAWRSSDRQADVISRASGLKQWKDTTYLPTRIFFLSTKEPFTLKNLKPRGKSWGFLSPSATILANSAALSKRILWLLPIPLLILLLCMNERLIRERDGRCGESCLPSSLKEGMRTYTTVFLPLGGVLLPQGEVESWDNCPVKEATSNECPPAEERLSLYDLAEHGLMKM